MDRAAQAKKLTEMAASAEETIDDLSGYRLRVIQPRRGYRFSLDPLLLCDFCSLRSPARVADLGTGCGIIPLLLARRFAGAEFVGIELQEELAETAERNVRLNGLEERVGIVTSDILNLKGKFSASSFDLVTANPPYRVPGTGRVSPRAGRDRARHESSAGLADFLAAAKYLVKPSGTICFVYHTSRLPELFTTAAEQKLSPLRLRLVYGSTDAPAKMVLLELVKGRRGSFDVLPPLIVREPGGEYTQEVKRICGEGAPVFGDEES